MLYCFLMKKLSFFLKLILLTAVLAGGFYFVRAQNSIKGTNNHLEEKRGEIAGSVRGVTDTIGQQTQDLSQRAQEINKHISRVLGSYIQPATEESSEKNNQTNSDKEESGDENQNNESENDADNQNNEENNENNDPAQTPIYEKTLEYGRYLYCKQVVKDYENQN